MSGDGTTALVGAYKNEDPNGEQAGAAYVFSRSGDDWTQQAKLAADDGDEKDRFGTSVALSEDGSTALIGAETDDGPNGDDAGAAYVFSNGGGIWTQQAKLAADDGDIEDLFGSSVALSGDGSTALVGAWRDEDPNGNFAGAAYVFSRSNDDWAQQAKLTADDGDVNDRFGWSTAVTGDGDTAIIGAVGDAAAYVFGASADESQTTTTEDTSTTPGDRATTSAPPTTGTGGGTTATTASGTPTNDDASGGSAMPGPGIVSVLSGFGVVWFLLGQRLDNDNQD